MDLRKGTDIIRVLLDDGSDYEEGVDFMRLVVGRCTDQIRMGTFDRLGNIIWNNRLEILFEIKFAKIAENYFTDMETGVQMRRKRYLRWKQKDRRAHRDLPDSFKSAALRYVQKQPRMKTCKLSDIERVTRVNRTQWNETLPDLRGYEIVARGKTFFIKAPRGDR